MNKTTIEPSQELGMLIKKLKIIGHAHANITIKDSKSQLCSVLVFQLQYTYRIYTLTTNCKQNKSTTCDYRYQYKDKSKIGNDFEGGRLQLGNYRWIPNDSFHISNVNKNTSTLPDFSPQ